MYESRLHATNGIVSLAVDALNGEILEFVREETGDNVVKSNCHPRAWSPFLLEIPDGEGIRRLNPPRYAQIMADPSLAPVVTVEQFPDSARIALDYPAVMERDEARKVSAHVEIELPAGDCRTRWRITVENHTSEDIERVVFPCLSGLWLGDTWEDDIIMLPHNAGLKVINPVKRLSEPPRTVYWKWQEYRYGYTLNGPCGTKDDRGSYVFELRYSGSASMLWTDLYDSAENMGVYLTCRNDSLTLKGLRAETFGEAEPGMGMSLIHFPCLGKDGRWESETCIVAMHRGDWHWGADEYRAWRESLPQPAIRRHCPEWFEKSTGLVAHYDFKYQNGGIVHRYADIPALLAQAEEMGFHHLLISGWNYDGFDHGFPQYRPDPELGTEAELAQAVRKVRDMGGHLAFYVNSRLWNTGYEERRQRILEGAIMRKDGSLAIESYGAVGMEFACMCNQPEDWRNELVGVVDYLTHTIGADSVYLDQLAMARGELCYHPAHVEHAGNPAGWNQGYREMLSQMRDGYDEGGMAMLYEGVSDIHGWGVSGQLISTMFSLYAGSFPEMYKYTFPDQILIDMMNPGRNSAMRAAHLSKHSTALLYRAFVTGSYLWVYDLEMDNSFRRDPEQYERLKKLNGLRAAWLESYGQGRFRDDVGLCARGKEILARRFDLADGVLVACANEQRVAGATVELVWEKPGYPRVIRRTERAPEECVAVDCEIISQSGLCKIVLPLDDDAELNLFVVS